MSIYKWQPPGKDWGRARWTNLRPAQPTKAPPDFWDPYGRPEDYSANRISPWNVVLLNGMSLPGVATVSAPQRHQKIDLRQIPGADGTAASNLGTEPAVVNVRLELWTPEHLGAWKNIWVPLLEPRAGSPSPGAFPIYHPALAIHRINTVYLKSVGLIQPGRAFGVFEVTLQLWEWKPVVGKGSNALNDSNIDKPGKVPTAPGVPVPSSNANEPFPGGKK